MREILFRGCVIDEPNKWVYGFLAPENTIIQCGNGHFKVVKDSVGEYTGCRDKDNIRIFENDIVYDIDEDEYYIVRYIDCAFVLMGIDGTYWKPIDTYGLVVIGNSFVID